MVQLYVVLVEVLDRYRLKTIWSDRRWKEVDAHGFLREVGQLRGRGTTGSTAVAAFL
jgi:hypothetical protein